MFSAASTADASQVVAECANPQGHAYYLETGIVQTGKGGWQEDKISKGRTLLIREEGGAYDIIYKDATNQTISSVASGAKIMLLRNNNVEGLFLLFYPGKTAEMYHFFKEDNGTLRYATYQNKGGVDIPISKNSLMVGACSQIDFSSIK